MTKEERYTETLNRVLNNRKTSYYNDNEVYIDCPCGEKKAIDKKCFMSKSTGQFTCESGRCGGKKGNAYTYAKEANIEIPQIEKAKIEYETDKVDWIYHTIDGKPLIGIKRFNDSNGKTYRQYRFENGKWKMGIRGISLPLYNAHKIASSKYIVIVEGEKTADRMQKENANFVVTTNIFGASGAGKFLPSYAKQLMNKKIMLVPDNDKTGRKHVYKIYHTLIENGIKDEDIRIVELPNLAEKEDAYDWLEKGNTFNQFIELIKKANNTDFIQKYFPLMELEKIKNLKQLHEQINLLTTERNNLESEIKKQALADSIQIDEYKKKLDLALKGNDIIEIEKAISEFNKAIGQIKDVSPFLDSVDDVVKILDKQSLTSGVLKFPSWMKPLWDLRIPKKKPTIITGLSGEGKTTLMANLIMSDIVEGRKALVYTYEMEYIELWSKIYSIYMYMEKGEIRSFTEYMNSYKIYRTHETLYTCSSSEVGLWDVGKAMLAFIEKHSKNIRILEAYKEVSKDFGEYENYTIKECFKMYLHYKAIMNRIDSVYIDYVQKVKPEKTDLKESEPSQYAKISGLITGFAKTDMFDSTMVVLSQLSTETAVNFSKGKEKKEYPRIELRYSGQFYHDSYMIIVVFRDKNEGGEYTENINVMIPKNRGGKVGYYEMKMNSITGYIGESRE